MKDHVASHGLGQVKAADGDVLLDLPWRQPKPTQGLVVHDQHLAHVALAATPVALQPHAGNGGGILDWIGRRFLDPGYV